MTAVQLHKKTWIAFLAIALTVFIFTGPALADDGAPGGLGQGNQHYTPSAQEQQLLQEKEALAAEFQLVSQGKLTMASYQHDLSVFYQQHGIKRSNAASAMQPAIPGAHALNVTQFQQQTDYYCGPASAEAVLSFLGYNTSQSTLAGDGEDELHTADNKSTNFGDDVMANALNHFGNTGGFYAQKGVSSLSVYEGDMSSDIASGWPVVIAAYENGYYLTPAENGWLHWFDVNSYTSSGATSGYVDPAAGMFSVPAYGSVNSSTIQGMMQAGGFGYVW